MKKPLFWKFGVQRIALCVLFVAMSVVGWAEKSSSITIEYLSAQKQKYELERLGYLELRGNEMIVKDKEGCVLHTTRIGDVKKVVMWATTTDAKTAVDDIANALMVVYPNPSMDELFVEGMDVGAELRVYTIDGTLVKVQKVEAEKTLIDVRDLAVGSYLIQSGDNIVKFIKE